MGTLIRAVLSRQSVISGDFDQGSLIQAVRHQDGLRSGKSYSGSPSSMGTLIRAVLSRQSVIRTDFDQGSRMRVNFDQGSLMQVVFYCGERLGEDSRIVRQRSRRHEGMV